MKDALLIVVCGVVIVTASGVMTMRGRAEIDAFHREVINYQRDTINRCDKHNAEGRLNLPQ